MNNQPEDDYVPFGPEWENHMKTLPKTFLINMIQAEGLKKQATSLSNSERNILAMALFGLSKNIGPSSVAEIQVIVDKLQVHEQFDFVSTQWDLKLNNNGLQP